ncbi:hypothetical protein JCM5350_007382 [Sporobolomyces pararoseus]
MCSAHQSTFRYQLFTICVALAHVIHGAPIPQPEFPTPLTVSTGLPTPTAPSSSTTASLPNAQQLWPSPLTLTDPSPSPSTTSSPTSTSVSSSTPEISIDTELVTITATETAAPITVTQTLLFTSTVIDTQTPSSAIFSSLPTPSSTIDSSPAPITSSTSASTTPTPSSKNSWEVPSDFSGNLTRALGSKRWSWGTKNAKLVESVPASAWATPSPSLSLSTNQAAVASAVDLSNGPAMQVTFPKGSINPANKKAPTGGVGLYISPLDLSKATNVSLEYSVFFPADFDFVKGGKLPGMYGGHKGCSGGQDSEDCFSTRLMFRTGGKGELYLYAPKSDPAQLESLCNTAPLSYCDSSYGFSIGRGAWTFERGAWSNIRQEIRLNTPGIADGGVRIFVNDKLVLSSDEVLYRADLGPTTPTSSSPFSSLPTAPPSPTEVSSAAPEATSSAAEDQGLLGGLLGGLADDLGKIIKRSDETTRDVFHTLPTITETVTSQSTETVFATSTVVSTPSPYSSSPSRAGLLGQVTGELPGLEDTQIISAVNDALPILGNSSILAPKKAVKDETATFQGIMFNTFFGGNDPSWASPEEQNIWFNRISLSVLA